MLASRGDKLTKQVAFGPHFDRVAIGVLRVEDAEAVMVLGRDEEVPCARTLEQLHPLIRVEVLGEEPVNLAAFQVPGPIDEVVVSGVTVVISLVMISFTLSMAIPHIS